MKERYTKIIAAYVAIYLLAQTLDLPVPYQLKKLAQSQIAIGILLFGAAYGATGDSVACSVALGLFVVSIVLFHKREDEFIKKHLETVKTHIPKELSDVIDEKKVIEKIKKETEKHKKETDVMENMKDGINIGLEDTIDTFTNTLTENSVELTNVKDEIEKKVKNNIDIREIELSVPTAQEKLDTIISHVNSETLPSHLATGEHTSVGEIIWD